MGILYRRRTAAQVQAITMRPILSALPIVVALSIGARSEKPNTFRGKTIEGWLAVFRDEASTEAWRSEEALMLGCFGPEARSAVPDLMEAVRKGRVRDEAVDALVNIGAGNEVTIPVLIDRFRKRGSHHLIVQGAISYDNSVANALARVG
jgi:hypothetical protein